MNRRGFFKLLGLTAAAAPIALAKGCEPPGVNYGSDSTEAKIKYWPQSGTSYRPNMLSGLETRGDDLVLRLVQADELFHVRSAFGIA